MPELPEVETIVRGLRPRVVGQRIERVRIRQAPSHGVVKSPLAAFRRILRGAHIREIGRRAKYILLGLDAVRGGGHIWIVHLGMSGQFYACKPAAEQLKHTHLWVDLSGGDQLRFCDPRRFGKTLVLSEGKAVDYFSSAAPDPLEMSPRDFAALLSGRKAPVKNLLLNQSLIGGVGNIYANEALFLARVHPATLAGKLPAERSRELHRVLRRVLREAIAGNGTTIADYRTSEGRPGSYQNRLRVYDREGEPCPRCGRPIRRLVLSQRSAHYCPGCQKMGR